MGLPLPIQIFTRILCGVQLLIFLLMVTALIGAPPLEAAPMEDLVGKKVVVDPGHGGDDWGVDPAGSGLREKEVALDITDRITTLLRARGAHVYRTRTADTFISLGARVRFANAVLFRPDNNLMLGRLISVHINSNPNPDLTRIEVLVDPKAEVPPFAVAMAERLEQATDGGFGYRDEGYPLGVHPADVAPVRWTYPRGHNVLTEAAFLSNREHAARLRDMNFLDRIAQAHVAALEQTLVGPR